MKAEQRHKLEQNELSKRLARLWQSVNSGSTTATVVWGAILLLLVVWIGCDHASVSQSRQDGIVGKIEVLEKYFDAELSHVAFPHS